MEVKRHMLNLETHCVGLHLNNLEFEFLLMVTTYQLWTNDWIVLNKLNTSVYTVSVSNKYFWLSYHKDTAIG